MKFLIAAATALFFNLSSHSQIIANDDVSNELNVANQSLTYGPFLSNDLLNGSSNVSTANVLLTQLSTTHPGININTNSPYGFVDIAMGTPNGIYYVNYKICETANPMNCATAGITIKICNVATPIISSVTQPNCSNNSSGSVLLTGLPSTGTWTINYSNYSGIASISGTGTSTLISGLDRHTSFFTVTNSLGCVSNPVYVTLTDSYSFASDMTGTYIDSNTNGFADIGDMINYQITITNTGRCNMDNIRVNQIGLAFTNPNITVAGTTNPVPSLAPGASTTLTGTYALTQSDLNNSIVTNSIGVAATYPGTSMAYPESCIVNLNTNGIRLTAFVDRNNNMFKDWDEPNYTYGDFQIATDWEAHDINASNGTYFINESNPSTIYTLSYSLNPLYSQNASCSTSYSNVTVNSGQGIVDYYFPVTMNPEEDCAVTVFAYGPPPVPGATYVNRIAYTNRNSDPILTGTVSFTKNSSVTITSISQTGTMAAPDGFTYSFTNLLPFETRFIDVTLQVPTIPTVALGELLTNSAALSALPNDLNASNNVSQLTQTIVGAFDPNNKVENHGGEIEHSSFSPADYFYYTIQFENTGTANANTVKITDQIDYRLQTASFEMVSASHNYTVEKDFFNTVTWTFDSINLPPTVPGTRIGKGYVIFKIKPYWSVVAPGNSIPNMASIFFDSNPPIETNTFNTEFVSTMSVSEFEKSGLVVYPNPTNGFVTVISEDNSALIESVIVSDISGKTVLSIAINAPNAVIDLSTLASGMYFAKARSGSHEKIVKLIKK